MERIVIEVEDDTAKKWRFSSQKTKNKIAQEINLKLATELEADSKEEFKEFLDELSKCYWQSLRCFFYRTNFSVSFQVSNL